MATGIKSTRDRSRSKGAYATGGGDGHRKRRGRPGWLPAARPTAARRRAAGPARRRRRRQAASRAADSDRRRHYAQCRAGQPPVVRPAVRRPPETSPCCPVPAGGLTAHETESATRKEVTVQSVVKDEGFWVGSSQRNRVYVEYGGNTTARRIEIQRHHQRGHRRSAPQCGRAHHAAHGREPRGPPAGGPGGAATRGMAEAQWQSPSRPVGRFATGSKRASGNTSA
jgi:hypothetical protein